MGAGVLEGKVRPDRRRAGLSASGTVSIGAIVSVLVFVSVPRLRGMALHENELDARATAQALARNLSAEEAHLCGAPTIASLLRADELSRQLADVELLEGGRLLRRHGYVFEVVALPERLPGLAALGPAPLLGAAARAARDPRVALEARPDGLDGAARHLARALRARERAALLGRPVAGGACPRRLAGLAPLAPLTQYQRQSRHCSARRGSSSSISYETRFRTGAISQDGPTFTQRLAAKSSS
jgi:hypothetical protein